MLTWIAWMLTVFGLPFGALLIARRLSRSHPKQIAICAASMCLPPLLFFLIWSVKSTEGWLALAVGQSMVAFAFIVHMIPWGQDAPPPPK
jgi:predicted MFS family arabinose efflux permease